MEYSLVNFTTKLKYWNTLNVTSIQVIYQSKKINVFYILYFIFSIFFFFFFAITNKIYIYKHIVSESLLSNNEKYYLRIG